MARYVDWVNQSVPSGLRYTGLSDCMLDICNKFSFDQIVNEPTRAR